MVALYVIQTIVHLVASTIDTQQQNAHRSVIYETDSHIQYFNSQSYMFRTHKRISASVNRTTLDNIAIFDIASVTVAILSHKYNSGLTSVT